MSPSDFIAKLAPAAQACQRATGIPASFTIAQAALESAWGALALGNNLFGIKADRSWKGDTVDFRTTEHIAGKVIHPTDRFRAYASWGDCVLDRARFLQRNPRYAGCFRETTGEGWARAVAAAGYATDPKYAEKIVAIIRGRYLDQFDKLSTEVKS